MTTDWVVSAAAEQINLDTAGQVELTFAVTNPGPVADRAVLEVVTSEQADRSWFTVELPQRLVSAGATVAYLVKAAVPAGAATGRHWLQARVYSADHAPEESSRLSGRVAFQVPDRTHGRPWWWVIVALALVVLVLGVTGWLVFGRDDQPPPPPPPPTPSATPAAVAMPELVGQVEAAAVDALADHGLVLGPVSYRHDPANSGTVLAQSVPPGTSLAPGDEVGLEVAVTLATVALSAPGNGASFPHGSAFPTLSWQAVPHAAGYQVTMETHLCAFLLVEVACRWPDNDAWSGAYSDYHARSTLPAATTTVTPQLTLRVQDSVPRAGHSGHIRWKVVALDDFGNSGPDSGFYCLYVTLRPPPNQWGPPSGDPVLIGLDGC
jgi:hypothetical protein